MKIYNGGLLILIGFVVGALVGSGSVDKAEIETKEPVEEEVYESGLYEKAQ